jgi:hypothetical protein
MEKDDGIILIKNLPLSTSVWNTKKTS